MSARRQQPHRVCLENMFTAISNARRKHLENIRDIIDSIAQQTRLKINNLAASHDQVAVLQQRIVYLGLQCTLLENTWERLETDKLVLLHEIEKIEFFRNVGAQDFTHFIEITDSSDDDSDDKTNIK